MNRAVTASARPAGAGSSPADSSSAAHRPSPPPRIGAVVLAGGRARRLDGAPKPLLLAEGRTLLARTLDALDAAGVAREDTVLVGPDSLVERPEASGRRVVREDPPFTGPVAAIEAGVAALLGGESDDGASDVGNDGPGTLFTLAADMPGVAAGVHALLDAAVPALTDAAGEDLPDAWVGESDADGPSPRTENLLALHRAAPLCAALAGMRTRDQAVRSLLAQLRITAVPLPAGAADDVDTWEDAERLGVRPAEGTA